MTVTVDRTVFTPTQLFDATWYVEPGQSITRLLPFFDVDIGEILTVSMLALTQHGELEFVLSDKVTYTASSDFSEDSFTFTVTGEDGLSSDPVTVLIETKPETHLAAKQKISISSEYAAFLSHNGHLYTWGRNDSGELGLTANSTETIFSPKKVDGEDWVDISIWSSQAFAIKEDGTLWSVGYDPFTQQKTAIFTQVGSDSDWESVISSHNRHSLLLTKSDGSIWGSGFDGSVFTNRPELSGEVAEITQILPIYNVNNIQYNDNNTGFALTDNNQVYSWGSNRLSDLGRSKDLGYLFPLKNIDASISEISSVPFRSILVAEGNIYAWGGGSSQLFLDQGEKFIEPTQISSEKWNQVALGKLHMAGIKQDGSLWTWGSVSFINDEPAINAQLARGEYPDQSAAQIGTGNNWLDVWAGEYTTFALDKSGQLWSAGGPISTTNSLNGLGENLPLVAELTLVKSIPIDITGTGDFDNDGLLDFTDPDDDNDGILDQNDAIRANADELLDTDNDGIANNVDTDDDGDGVADADDVFPLDSSESTDTDADGIGNNTDTDDDGDGVADTDDAFPLDSSESTDTDADGIGNNADADDDNDGVNDTNDAFPLDASRSQPPSLVVNQSDSSGGGSLAFLLLFTLLCSRRILRLRRND